jgi:hypothetical protein
MAQSLRISALIADAMRLVQTQARAPAPPIGKRN